MLTEAETICTAGNAKQGQSFRSVGAGGGQGGVWGGGGGKAFHLSHPMKLGSFVSIALMFLLKLFQPAAAAAKSLQSCPTLCDPIESSPPGSPIPGLLQARTLEWVAISFSNVSK